MVWPYLCLVSVVPLICSIVFGVLLSKTNVFTVSSSIVKVDSCINDCYNVGNGNACTPKILGTFTWQFENISYEQGNFTMDSVNCKQICCHDAVNRTGSMQIDEDKPYLPLHFFDDGVVPFHTTYQALFIISVTIFAVLVFAGLLGFLIDDRRGYHSIH